MTASWWEVWGDGGLVPPYLLIVLGYDGPEAKYKVLDPQQNGTCVFQASIYTAAEDWLLEDEYERHSERIATSNSLPS